jgi:hypothetical protein
MCLFDKFKNFFTCLARGVPILVTLSSLATAVIPNPAPGEVGSTAYQVLTVAHKVLDVLALNINQNTPSQ